MLLPVRLRIAALVACATFAGASTVAVAQPAFDAPFYVYSSPLSLASLMVADVNDDGTPDLVGHTANGNLFVRPGTGPGPMPPAGSPIISNSIAAGDLNHDGHVDLAVARAPTPNTLLVYLGAGDGTFALVAQILAPQPPRSVVMADLNEDGNLDVATYSVGAATYVSTWAGLGDGQFAPRADVTIDWDSPLDMVAGDIDNDTHVDLLYTNNFLGSAVRYLPGNGDGTFQAPRQLTTGLFFLAGGLAAGDMNGDGICDYVLTDGDMGTVSIGFGNGDGTFHWTGSMAGTKPRSVAIGDFNGDGYPDLVVTNDLSQDIVILLNTGADTFTRFAVLPVGFASPQAFDWTGDGVLDLVGRFQAPPPGGAGFKIMPGNGDGTFGIPTFDVGQGGSPTALAIGDLNQDGWPDVAAIKGYAGMSIRLGQPGRTFAPQTDYLVAEYPQGVTMGDVNHDGFVDIVVASYYFVSILPGDGAGSLGARTDFPATNAHSPVLADLDQDGNLDVILAETGVTFRLGDGAGGLAAPQSLATPSTPSAVRAPDFNGDGLPDLATANETAGSLSVFLNLGGGAFAPRVDYPSGTKPLDLCSGDFNADGNVDIAVANNGSHSLAIFEGDGLGSFSRLPDVAGVSLPLAVATLDANHDGRLDIVALSEWTSVASVHHGLGDGTFASSDELYGFGHNTRSLAVGDMDQDGETDVVLANYANNYTEVKGSFAVLWNNYELPIAVSLLSFNATREPDGVRVSWEVPEEGRRRSFALLRSAPTGAREPVVSDPFTGRSRYDILDQGAPAGAVEYWLRETTETGAVNWLGPARVIDGFSNGRLALSPNPARGPVTLTFGLETIGPVRIQVFDIGGRLVARLVDRHFQPGPHVMAWDARDREGRRLSPGLYFVRLNTAVSAEVERIVIMR